MPKKDDLLIERDGAHVTVGTPNPLADDYTIPKKADKAVTGSTIISDTERAVLKTVLDRDRTSKLVHGGLKSLLTLTDDQAKVLLDFLARI